MAGFLSLLELEYLDGARWRIMAEFDYCLGKPDGPERVEIPSGFFTDFASIPRLFWNIFPPTGSYGKAAVVHDWLYQHQTVVRHQPTSYRFVNRGEADRIFLEAMTVLSVGWWTRHIIYFGVRAGGWSAWNAYRGSNDFQSRDTR